MEKLTENLNIIQSLPARPTLMVDDLQAKFDEAAGIIKNYLNLVVEPAVTNIENNYTKQDDLKDYKTELQNTLDSFQETLNGLDEQIQKAVSKATTSSDFVVTTHSIHYVRTQSQGDEVKGSYTKDGHKPLGLVGHYYTNIYSATCNGARVTSINDTSIAVQGYVARGNTGGTTEGDLVVNILWVKVK